MRRTLIGFLLGATMATPMAASAQESEVAQSRAERRQERTVQRAERRQVQPPQRAQIREAQVQERTEAREARVQERTERREARAQERTQRRADPARQPRPDVQVPTVEGRASTWPGQQERTRRVLTEARRERREDRREERRDVRQDRREDRADRRDDRRDVRADRRDTRREWNRDWRNDRRYDWQRYRYANRNLYRIGRYYSPYRNHSYSRFSIGLRLGSGFYSDRYWINDPWQYRLPPAYAGTRWIRYYDDVLLVDMYSGQVLDVIYNFFW
jgi:hypothetical protein